MQQSKEKEEITKKRKKKSSSRTACCAQFHGIPVLRVNTAKEWRIVMSEPTKTWRDCFIARPLFYEAKHWKYHIFACATMCFTPQDCDSAAATYCMDLIKGSFVNATILNKVLSFRTIVSIYLAWRATTTTLLCLFMEIPTKRRLSYCLGMGRWIYMYFLFQKVAGKWLA